MNVLCDAQTYVGVLATFVVLCLFSIRRSFVTDDFKQEEKSSSRVQDYDSNFIYALIRQVGADSLTIIKKEVESLKELSGSCYNKKEIDGKTRMQRVVERAQSEHPEKNYEQLLMKAQARYKSSISDFLNKADEKIKAFERTQRMGLKEELTFVALMNLIFIVIVMMVDTLSFVPDGWRAVWMNLLVASSSPFMVYLYVRFLRNSRSPLRPKTEQKDWSRTKIISLASSPIALWLLVASFVCVPWFSLLLIIPMMSLFYLFTGRLLNQMYGVSDINKSFILKLSSYFLIMALILSALFILCQQWSFLYIWGASHGLAKFFDNANGAVELLFSTSLAKGAVVLFFSLNVFILPLLLGSLYIHQQAKALSKEIREMFNLSEGAIKEANLAFEQIILEMDTKSDNNSEVENK